MSPEAIKTVIVAVIAVLLFAAGWVTEGWRKDAEIDRIKLAHANERADAERATAAVITAALKHGNELAARVTAAESTRDTALQETQDALRKITTGKPCLSGAAVRLLNDSNGLKAAVPAVPSGESARADAAVATDTDVAQWVAYAIRSYDTCRGRLDAIGDFYKDADQ
jgi:prophage endopeptidase